MCGVENMSDEINGKRGEFLGSLILLIPAIILLTLSILHFKGIFSLFYFEGGLTDYSKSVGSEVYDGLAYLCGGIGLLSVSFTIYFGLNYIFYRLWDSHLNEILSVLGTGCIIAIIAGLLRIPGWDAGPLFGSNLLSEVVCNLCCWGMILFVLWGGAGDSGGRGEVLLRRRTSDVDPGDDVGE